MGQGRFVGLGRALLWGQGTAVGAGQCCERRAIVLIGKSCWDMVQLHGTVEGQGSVVGQDSFVGAGQRCWAGQLALLRGMPGQS